MSSVLTPPNGPRTINLPGTNAQTARYVLPPGVAQYVESVLAKVDTAGSGAVRPTLRVLSQPGVVIATKRQGQRIPGSDTGTATWALRLTDEVSEPQGYQAQFINLDPGGNDTIRLQDVIPNTDTSFNGNIAALTQVAVWTLPANGRLSISVTSGDDKDTTAILQLMNVQRLDVLARERLSGDPALLPAGGGAQLSVDAHLFGANLIDFTTPTVPKIVNAGTYAITVQYQIIG